MKTASIEASWIRITHSNNFLILISVLKKNEFKSYLMCTHEYYAVLWHLFQNKYFENAVSMESTQWQNVMKKILIVSKVFEWIRRVLGFFGDWCEGFWRLVGVYVDQNRFFLDHSILCCRCGQSKFLMFIKLMKIVNCSCWNFQIRVF